MPSIYKVIIFVIVTIGILWVSRSSLRDPQSHGFYRTFVFESILILFLLAVDAWFVEPFSPPQIISRVFLIISLVLIIQGVRLFREKGKINQERNEPALVGIERTTELVTTGVYKYIRHPFYSSLLFLGWGILLKDVNWISIFLAVITTALLVVMARKEESENLRYFDEKYQVYMQKTKMFIPTIF